MKEKDTATSSAAAFLMLLLILTAVFALWAAVVLPAELQEAEAAEAKAALSALSDAAFLLEALPEVPFAEDASLSLALPAGTLQTKDCGMLILCDTQKIPLRSLAISPGGDTAFGILAGGVWRKDGGYAAWQIFPQISCTKTGAELTFPVFSGNAAYGSAEPVPVTFSLTGRERCTLTGTELTLTAVSADEWVLSLWETVFSETAYRYQDVLNAEVWRESRAVTLELLAKNGADLTLSAEIFAYAVTAGGGA